MAIHFHIGLRFLNPQSAYNPSAIGERDCRGIQNQGWSVGSPVHRLRQDPSSTTQGRYTTHPKRPSSTAPLGSTYVIHTQFIHMTAGEYRTKGALHPSHSKTYIQSYQSRRNPQSHCNPDAIQGDKTMQRDVRNQKGVQSIAILVQSYNHLTIPCNPGRRFSGRIKGTRKRIVQCSKSSTIL